MRGDEVILYHWLGWISLAICLLLLAKYIGRVSKYQSFNRFLRKAHKPLGIAVTIIGIIHGFISFMKHSQDVTANVSGLFTLVVICLLAATFCVRTKLKSRWFVLHWLLSIVLIVLLTIHTAIAVF